MIITDEKIKISQDQTDRQILMWIFIKIFIHMISSYIRNINLKRELHKILDSVIDSDNWNKLFLIKNACHGHHGIKTNAYIHVIKK